jgi:glycosyltransferase involved in cell wall biosynthesis
MNVPRRVRVLFVNDTARNGGPGRSLHSILKFLDPAVVYRALVLPRAGPIADLVTADGSVEELHLLPDFVENPVQPWGRPMERRDFDAPVVLRGVRLGGNVLKAARAIGRLSRWVRRGRFDLIYCNGSSADFAGGALARLTGVPALWHVRYTSVPSAVAGLHRSLSASEGVGRIVCVSLAAASLFPHCADKVMVVHNALDIAAFDPARVTPTLRAELGLSSDAIIFGSHGRVLRRKGYVEMIRAAHAALRPLGEEERRRVAFVIVGDTPEDHRPDHVDECRALARELGIAANVHMMGFRLDVRPLLADFDVAIVPSVYPDPLPRAVLESMALGKPVIAFDVGGVAEMLDHDLTGTLVPIERGPADGASPASVHRLAEAIVRYVRDGELRMRQGLAARRRVERDFDARVHGRVIEDEIVRLAFRRRAVGASDGGR